MQSNTPGGAEVAATQLVLYTDDSVDAVFSDGGHLQLSACGATFVHRHRPNSNDHPLQPMETIQQRSRFVTSVYRDKLKAALNFRNRFASRPYLCDVAVDPGTAVRLYADIFEVAWPASASCDDIEVLPDRSLKLTSVDEYAQVILGPSGQHFTVKFLCRLDESVVWQPRQTPPTVRSGHSGDAAAILTGACWDYAWTVQHHLIIDYPDEWRHPVELLLGLIPTITGDNGKNGKQDSDLTNHKESPDVVTSLVEKWTTKQLVPCVVARVPQTLPLNCSSQLLHRWRNDDSILPSGGNEVYYGGRLKVVCSRGLIYRLTRIVPAAVAIYPGDGTVIESAGATAMFFRHYVRKNEKIEERMYSVESPPPHVPGFPYSISKLLKTATRFLQQVHNENLQLLPPESAVCWQTKCPDIIRPLASVLLEECNIPGVGKFTAHSSGHVRIVFPDRTCLDMHADFRKRIEICRQHSESEVPAMTSQWTEVPTGVCRLLLPSGHYHNVQVSNPANYAKYTEGALDWAGWVNSSPSERYTYYKDSPYDAEKRHSVESELKKIRCFNYLLDSRLGLTTSSTRSALDKTPHQGKYRFAQPISGRPSNCSKEEEVNFGLIHDVLRKTSAAVQDLDRFLTVNGETKPVRN